MNNIELEDFLNINQKKFYHISISIQNLINKY